MSSEGLKGRKLLDPTLATQGLAREGSHSCFPMSPVLHIPDASVCGDLEVCEEA